MKRQLAGCIFSLLLMPCFGMAHELLFEAQVAEPSSIHASFGDRVIVVSDINADGQKDVLISQDTATVGMNSFAGKVHAFSGSNAQALFTLSGGAASDLYGDNLVNLGDLNADGYDEFSIFFYEDGVETDVGEIEIFGTKLLNLITSKTGFLESDDFGISAIGIPDLNANGSRDYVIFGGHTDTGKGRIVAYDGSTHALIYAVQGTQDNGRFGLNLQELGDIDADGVSDLVVFAPFEEPVDQVTGLPDADYNKAGRIHVLSGRTGAVIYLIAPKIAEAKLGSIFTVIDDLDDDGFNDIAAGCSFCGDSIYPNGYLNIYSGADGAQITQILPQTGEDIFCSDIATLGDVNADGRGDFACLTDKEGASQIQIYRGGTFEVLETIAPNAGESIALISSADLNADGALDLVVTGLITQGAVGVVRIYDLDIAAPQNFTLNGRVMANGKLRLKHTFNDDFELCDLTLHAASTQQRLNNNQGRLVYGVQIDDSDSLVLIARNLPGLISNSKEIAFRTTINCGGVTEVSATKSISFAPNNSAEKVGKGALIRKIGREIK